LELLASAGFLPTGLTALRVPMLERPFHKAFCIFRRCGISKCIVLFTARFIEVQWQNAIVCGISGG